MNLGWPGKKWFGIGGLGSKVGREGGVIRRARDGEDEQGRSRRENLTAILRIAVGIDGEMCSRGRGKMVREQPCSLLPCFFLQGDIPGRGGFRRQDGTCTLVCRAVSAIPLAEADLRALNF